MALDPIKSHIRQGAGDEQQLQHFKEFYDKQTPEQRQRLIALVSGISDLMGGSSLEAHAELASALGCDYDGFFHVDVSFGGLLEGPTSKVCPTLLDNALACWERGEPYLPV